MVEDKSKAAPEDAFLISPTKDYEVGIGTLGRGGAARRLLGRRFRRISQALAVA